MTVELLHTLIHASDPHLSFRADSFSNTIAAVDPMPDPLTDFGDELFQGAHWPSLERISDEIESRLRSSEATCVFSGDLCTQPLQPSVLAQAYSFFSGRLRHRDYEAGIPMNLRDRVSLLLGNHDTFTYWNTAHYVLSQFEAHGGGVVAPLRVRPIPTRVGHRWVVLFLVRSDWIGPTGWFGPLPGALDWWDAERRLRHEDSLLRAGRRVGTGSITGPQYETALKVVVIHHSPLERTDYKSLKDRAMLYRSLQLVGRERLVRLVKELGIHLVLFGHTHEQRVIFRDGTIYADAGTAAAARREDLGRGFSHAFNVFALAANDELLVRQFRSTRDTRGFEEDVTETRAYAVNDTRLVPSISGSPSTSRVH